MVLDGEEVPYTAPEILLMIAAVGAIFVNAINAWRTGSSVRDSVTKLSVSSERTLEKAAIIEGHVNSKETKLVEEITYLRRENEILKTVISDKDKTAALLAQSLAGRTRVTDIRGSSES